MQSISTRSPLPRQRRGLNRGACGPMIAEDARVDRIHLLELGDVQQEHPAAQDVLEIGTGGLQNRADVGQALFGLRRDVGPRKAAGGGIVGALARDEDEALEGHARRVRPGRRGQMQREDRTMSRHAPAL